MKIYESIEELKYPQEYEDGLIIIHDEFNEGEVNDPGVPALFERSRDNNLSIFIISQENYELPKRSIRANGNIYHISKPNILRDVLNIYQDKSSMEKNHNEFKSLTFLCWKENCQPLTIDKTKDKYTGRCRLGINSKFVPSSLPFKIIY